MSLFLIDSSAAWRLQRDESLFARWDPVIIEGDVRSCAPQRAEFLRSAQNVAVFEAGRRLLEQLYPDVPVPKTVWRWIDSAQFRLAASSVLRAFSLADLLICATAAHHGLTVLHDDGDFEIAAEHLTDVRALRVTRAR